MDLCKGLGGKGKEENGEIVESLFPMVYYDVDNCFVCGMRVDRKNNSRNVASLRFDNVVISPQIAAIKVASVKIEAGGIHLQNIDVFPWGAFSDDDLEVLEGSLRDTISAIQPDRESSSEREIYLAALFCGF
jgi:hypothetical protein